MNYIYQMLDFELKKVSPPSIFAMASAVMTLAMFVFLAPIMAETLTSPNYQINGATLDGSGSVVDSSGTSDFSLFSSIGVFSGNPRSTSTSYQLREENPDVFQANVPAVACFETVSDGSSSCTSGPSYLNTHGMVRVCGKDGCYNRARVEIDTQNNPSDTLYSIQISDDGFTSDIRVIDGVSYIPKDFADRQLADYLTQTDWETPTFNMEELQSNTTYTIRLVALHGDFTESSPGPTATATTANATLEADIDIDDQSGEPTETGSPYAISFTGDDKLFQGGAYVINTDLIWLDLETNGVGGAAIVVKGDNGGLYSTTTTQTIPSGNLDLASNDGFGIQNYDYSGSSTYQEDYSGSGGSNLGAISVESNYDGTASEIGEIDTDFLKVYDASGPIDDGRTSLLVKAKADGSTNAASDYTETITIVAVGRY